MSRVCGVCRELGRRRLMKDDRRHLHELEPGDAFEFPASGDVSRLVEVSSGRAEIEDPTSGKEVQFETFEGEEVSFQRNGTQTRPCAPAAEVLPLAR